MWLIWIPVQWDNPITWSEFAEIAEKCTTDDYVGAHIIMDHGEGLPYALEPMYPLRR